VFRGRRVSSGDISVIVVVLMVTEFHCGEVYGGDLAFISSGNNGAEIMAAAYVKAISVIS